MRHYRQKPAPADNFRGSITGQVVARCSGGGVRNQAFDPRNFLKHCRLFGATTSYNHPPPTENSRSPEGCRLYLVFLIFQINRNDVYYGTGLMPCHDLGDGWYFEQIVRQQGKSAGQFDTYYYRYRRALFTLYFRFFTLHDLVFSCAQPFVRFSLQVSNFTLICLSFCIFFVLICLLHVVCSNDLFSVV